MVNRKFVFNFDCFVYCFYICRKANFLIMELIVSFPDDIELSSGQLKIFTKSVIDPKCLLKFEATSFCFKNNLSFSSNIFSCILLFLFEKYGLHAFQNSLELQSILGFSKCWNMTYLFRFASKFRCRLNLTMWSWRDLVIICLWRFLLKWGFWFPRTIFFS